MPVLIGGDHSVTIPYAEALEDLGPFTWSSWMLILIGVTSVPVRDMARSLCGVYPR